MQQPAKRSALTTRVHAFWDAIDRGQASGQGPVDFERLMSIVTTTNKFPKDEINRELENAIKDQLIITDVIQTQKREETEIYKLPDVSEFTKGDHDWYCFQCHEGGKGPVVACEDCPRIFHLDCLPDDRKPQKDLFVCPPCHITATKPSAERLNIRQKQLNTLLEYSCSRFHEWNIPFLNNADGKAWAEAFARDPAKDAWRYDMLVYFPIDLTHMLEKARTGKYTSLEEYQVDCETLVHGVAVYFGIEHIKGQAITSGFARDVAHDIQEIKLCHDCFRRSNEKEHAWWFCLPCSIPHEVVWAKQSGYPFWPAKVMKVDGSKYDVRYFGGNYERGIIDVKNIQPIDTPLSSLRIRKTAAWNEAYDELQKFRDIASNPDLINTLPATKGGKSATPKGNSSVKSKASKRAATSSPVDDIEYKKRKSNAAPRKSIPAAKTGGQQQARARKSASAVLTSAKPNLNTSGVQSNGLAGKKKAATPKSSAAARRDSGTLSPGLSRVRGLTHDTFDFPESFDPEDIGFITAVEEIAQEESVNGDAYFSDEEQNEQQEKASEDAVSSSVNERKGTRNAYVQATSNGLSGRLDMIRSNLTKYINSVKERHAQEISALKKKQWCYHCEREAIYHCCWNTAYCSIECQQLHWTKEHKRMCRRVRRDRSGTGGNTQGSDEY